MKNILLLIFLLPLFMFGANEEKIIRLKKINKPINIDGVIDEEWSLADSVYDFIQFQPYYGKSSQRKTIAKLLTTESSLFCLIICYEKKEYIQSHNSSHDNTRNDVFISIMLDTFGDKKTAYEFGVTASGASFDCRILDDARYRDYNWDGVWFSNSKIYDGGYVIEIKIPYKSIQYDENLTYWGLDINRWISVLKENSYWCVYEQNEG